MSRFSDISNKVTSAIFGKSNAKKKSRKVDTVPASVQRLRQDAESRRLAIQEAEQAFFPFRVKMQRLYLNTAENGFVSACIDRRKDLTLLRKWEFKTKGGGTDEKLTSIFCNQIDGKTSLKQWFENFISFALDAKFYGYSLIYLGDVVNGEIVGTEVEKRWLVSPDRCMISRFEYMTTGVDFIVDPEVQDSYVWVSTPNDQGTSTCGFGEFFKRYRRHFNMNVDSVQQRSGNLTQIPLHLGWRRTDRRIRIVKITTRTRIHARHQHK